jgi:hypothetical protein
MRGGRILASLSCGDPEYPLHLDRRSLAAAGTGDLEGIELGGDLAKGGGASGLNLGDRRQDLCPASPPSSVLRAFAAASAALVP